MTDTPDGRETGVRGRASRTCARRAGAMRCCSVYSPLHTCASFVVRQGMLPWTAIVSSAERRGGPDSESEESSESEPAFFASAAGRSISALASLALRLGRVSVPEVALALRVSSSSRLSRSPCSSTGRTDGGGARELGRPAAMDAMYSSLRFTAIFSYLPPPSSRDSSTGRRAAWPAPLP